MDDSSAFPPTSLLATRDVLDGYGWTVRTLAIKKGNTRQRRSRVWRRWRRAWNGYKYRAHAWIMVAS